MNGFVKDEDDQPIDGARISVANRRHDVFSSHEGDFWRLLVPGSYEITVSAKGFEPETKSCTVLSDKAAKLNFNLKKMRMREPRHQVQIDMWPRERILNEDDYRHIQEKDPSQYRDPSQHRVPSPSNKKMAVTLCCGWCCVALAIITCKGNFKQMHKNAFNLNNISSNEPKVNLNKENCLP